MVDESIASGEVRTRRAYFDCRFGQLHVRTAFPTTGGFDEGVPLVCLHPESRSSRTFAAFLKFIANDRSAYAPDLPGWGESDRAPGVSSSHAAQAVADMADDLRLRRIDLLGFGFGAAVALEMAAARPELVRRVVVLGTPPRGLPAIEQVILVIRTRLDGGEASQWTREALPQAQFMDLSEDVTELFDASPGALAAKIGDFLRVPP